MQNFQRKSFHLQKFPDMWYYYYYILPHPCSSSYLMYNVLQSSMLLLFFFLSLALSSLIPSGPFPLSSLSHLFPLSSFPIFPSLLSLSLPSLSPLSLLSLSFLSPFSLLIAQMACECSPLIRHCTLMFNIKQKVGGATRYTSWTTHVWT